MQDANVRVLLVESALRENGGVRVSLEHARRWAAAGVDATVAVMQNVDDEPLAQVHPSIRIEFMTRRNSRFRYSFVIALLRTWLRARRATVVLSSSETGNGLLIGYVAARLAHRPFAVLVQADLQDAVRTWTPAALRRITLWVHAHSDAAVCVAHSLLAGVVENGLPAARTQVISNGVDVATIRALAGHGPAQANIRHMGENVEPDGHAPPVVMGSGRLHEQKDFSLLLRAHARVLARGYEHRLIIIGEGPARPVLEKLAVNLGIQDSLSLPGFSRNPYQQLAKADLFILSSRTEAMPLTLLEALAVGTPIISTRCGGGPDLILESGRYGQLLPVGSLEALSDAIEMHLINPAVLQERAAGGPIRAMDFDSELASIRLLRFLTALARSHSEKLRSNSP